MGLKGTDVAKEASDMVLKDDNFSSIVDAIEGGRGIYDNIKKFIEYLLSANLGEVLIVATALFMGVTNPQTGIFLLPVTAIQLLWINLLTDGLPALALGNDPHAPHIMERKPRDPKEKIMNKGAAVDMGLVAIIMTLGTLGLFYAFLLIDAAKAVTMAFTAIVFFELFYVNNVRLKHGSSFFSNKGLFVAILSSLILQLIVIYLPALQPVFDTVPLSFFDLGLTALVSSSIFIIMLVKSRVFNRHIS
jgi:Ca2+-transporting ATPase